MLSIIKNDWERTLEQKMYLIVAIGLTIASVVAAIILTNKVVAKENIAVVGTVQKKIDSQYINVTYLKEKPAESELVENRYDAIVSFDVNGKITIDTVKNQEYRNHLLQAITHPEQFRITKEANTRKIGTNIFGYMMMFQLMQGALYARTFAEDKEKHIAERVLVSPIHFRDYIFGHGIFLFLMIFIPSFGVLAAAKILGAEIGFGLGQFAILVGILALLSSALALCINSFFKVADTANMICSVVVVLTSVLGGSFYSLTKEGSLLSHLLHLLPQKDLLSFADAWEKGILSLGKHFELLYVIILAVVLFTVAVLKTRKDYIYNRSE